MTLDELRAKLAKLEDGLAELRQMTLRQEGAVLILRELVQDAERAAAERAEAEPPQAEK